MPFGNYDLHHSRRPTMNPRPLGGRDDSTAIDKSKYCPRCNYSLSFIEEAKVWACCKCAWGLPSEVIEKSRQRQQQQQEPAVAKGLATTTADADNKEGEDIHVVSKKVERRGGIKRSDGLDYLRGDDAYLQKQGLVFVTDVIDFADDHKTVSSEELRKQNLRLRGKTIR